MHANGKETVASIELHCTHELVAAVESSPFPRADAFIEGNTTERWGRGMSNSER